MTDLTPNAEAVSAAAAVLHPFMHPTQVARGDGFKTATEMLTAALPALTAQIRAATVGGLRAERERALKARDAADNPSDEHWQIQRAFAMARAADYLERTALLPAPENAEKENGDD